MEGIKVFIVTDNNEGKRITEGFRELDTQVEEFASFKRISKIDTQKYYVALLIVHLDDMNLTKTIRDLEKVSSNASMLKFVFLRRNTMKQLDAENYNILHLEFLLRPVRLSEFFLLMEKSIMAERFKTMLQESSKNLKDKGDGVEYLFEVFRKKMLEEKGSSNEIFEKILHLQQKMNEETDRTQRNMNLFSRVKQKNLYVEDQILIEELLGPILPLEQIKNQDKLKAIENLQDSNIDLEEALIAAQSKILDLQYEVESLKKS